MTPEQHRRVRDVFERALDAAPDDLAAWLAETVPDDAEVRDEVASLLAHDRRAGSFLAAPAVMTTPDDAEPLQPGAEVGAYRIEREIGRGGMGRVYLAEDRRLGRRVALKAIAPELAADGPHRERLRREARAMAALTDPAICAVYALEEFDGRVFLVSEFVDGRTLRDEIDGGGQRDADTLMKTAVDLASALAGAHGRGVIHRDLKPGNVMHTADGRVKVLDFGLARLDRDGLKDSRDTITGPGAMVGTPLYMSPEQLTGGTVDARSDVFAFGVLMYEYACGVHPFEAGGASMATLARILEAEPVPIETRRPDVPPALARVIARCLKKQPADRFPSAREIVAELTRAGGSAAFRPHTRWWRVHQVAMIAVYLIACADAWSLKERAGTPALTWAFIALGVLAASGGIVRAHLLFTERVTPSRFAIERRRTRRSEAVVDILLAVILFAEGLFLAAFRPVTSVLTMALAIGIAAAAILIEPATAAAAFPDPPARSR